MSKWEEMSTEQRNALIHTKVMNQPLQVLQVPCTGHITWVPDPFNNHPHGYWQCEYGHTGVLEDTAHMTAAAVPNYTTSMDAAWQIFQAMSDAYMQGRIAYDQLVDFAESIRKRWDTYAGMLNPVPTAEDICVDALRACGVDTESVKEKQPE